MFYTGRFFFFLLSHFVAIEKIKSRQSGYRTVYPEVKVQSAIYPSWSNTYDQQLGSSCQFCDTDLEKVGS